MLLRSAEQPRSMAASSPRGVTLVDSFDQRAASWTRTQQGQTAGAVLDALRCTWQAARTHVSVTEAASLEVLIVLFITADLLGRGRPVNNQELGEVGAGGF